MSNVGKETALTIGVPGKLLCHALDRRAEFTQLVISVDGNLNFEMALRDAGRGTTHGFNRLHDPAHQRGPAEHRS